MSIEQPAADDIEFLPGFKFNPCISIIENVTAYVAKNGPLQNLPALLIADTLNQIIAGTSTPWNRRCTTKGALYALGAYPTKKNVYALSAKLCSVWQATLETKYNDEGDQKIAVVSADAIKEEEIALDFILGAEIEGDVGNYVFVDETNMKYYRYDTCPDKEVTVGVQIRAKQTGHKNAMRYLVYEQVATLDSSKFDEKIAYKKPVGDILGKTYSKKIKLPADFLKESVKILNTMKKTFTEATWEHFKSKARASQPDNERAVEGRFKGALRGFKGVANSRKNRRRPKAQSARTSVGQYGTGKANPRTRSQGARAAVKKKSTLMKNVQSFNAYRKQDKIVKKDLAERCTGLAALISKMLWISDPVLDQLALGRDEAFTTEYISLLAKIADDRDLYGDTRNCIHSIPIDELMIICGKPALFRHSGVSFLFEAQQYLSEESRSWAVDSYSQKSSSEQSLSMAQGCCVQTLNTGVLAYMVGLNPTHLNNRLPGWNSPYSSHGEFTNLKDGTVLTIHKNPGRKPLLWLPKALVRGRRTETSVASVGSSLIGMEGEFMCQLYVDTDNPKKSAIDCLQEIEGQTVKKGRSGFARAKNGQIIEDTTEITFKMMNPQQIGHFALIETTQKGFTFGGLEITACELNAANKFMKGEPSTTTLEKALITNIYILEDPYMEKEMKLKTITRDVYDRVKALPRIGKEMVAEQTITEGKRQASWTDFLTGGTNLGALLTKPTLTAQVSTYVESYNAQSEELDGEESMDFGTEGGYSEDPESDYRRASSKRAKRQRVGFGMPMNIGNYGQFAMAGISEMSEFS